MPNALWWILSWDLTKWCSWSRRGEMWKNPNVGAIQHVTKWLWNTFTCGGVYAMYVAFDIPLDCQAEKEQLRTHDGMCNFIFEICEPWGREECRVGRRVYVLVYIGFIMWTCTPIYHVYVWRICLWYICVGRARCVGGSPCSYKNAFSLLIAVYSLGWKRTMWAPSKPQKKVSEKLYSARCLTMFNSNC